MSSRILVIDIETLPAIVERFDLKPTWTSPECVIVPARVLCFAAKWHGQPDMIFEAAWEDDDEQAFKTMVVTAWQLFDDADVIVGWNSTRFDIKYLNAAFGRFGLGPPSPSKSLDLLSVARKNFNEMSYKLDYFSRFWLGEQKLKHSGIEMWQHIRRGTEAQKFKSQNLMKKYNLKDVRLTEKLFDEFRSWTTVNFTVMDPDLDEYDRLVSCPKCGSDQIQSRGKQYTNTYAYDRFRCSNCGGWSRGRRMVHTTELRCV